MNDVMMDNLTVACLVMMRLTGMIVFNPIFSRKNVPIYLQMGLVLALTIISMNTIQLEEIEVISILQFTVELMQEFLIGFFIGTLVYQISSIFMISGELMDLQIGIAMSKIYDPQSNISMPVTGSIYNTMMMMIFFMSNAHLAIIGIVVSSFGLIPPGVVVFDLQGAAFIVDFFGAILTLAIKLSLPMLAVQFISEVGVGIMMKAIPQINVFVVNIQLKVLVGFAVILLLIPNVSDFIDYVLNILLTNIENGLQFFI